MQKSLDRGWFPCRGITEMHHGKPMGWDGADLAQRTVRAIKMQRIKKNADIRAGGGTYNLSCGFEVRHRGPGKKFQQCRKPITLRWDRDASEAVGKARMA